MFQPSSMFRSVVGLAFALQALWSTWAATPALAKRPPPPVAGAADSQALEAHKPLLRECYRGNVAQAMGMRGELVMAFAVRKDGNVNRVELVQARTGMPKYRDRCAVAAARKAQLPAGRARQFTYRFAWREGRILDLPEPVTPTSP